MPSFVVTREVVNINTVQWEHILKSGVDEWFVAKVKDINDVEYYVNPSSHWKLVDTKAPDYTSYLTLYGNEKVIAIYSKRAFMYPRVIFTLRLPDWSTLFPGEIVRELYFGLENGSGGSIATFHLSSWPSGWGYNQLVVSVGPHRAKPWFDVMVTNMMPSDAFTAKHSYQVAITRNMAIFYIDGKPVAFDLFVSGVSPAAIRDNTPPYAIFYTPPVARSLPSLLEIASGKTSTTQDISIMMSQHDIRIQEGSDTEPLVLPLYYDSSSTLMRRRSVTANTTVYSHPVPILGYSRKTIYFMANASGTLNVEIYTISGNWRTYDSRSYSANTLAKISITDEGLVARISYTPTATATILEAEAYMS